MSVFGRGKHTVPDLAKSLPIQGFSPNQVERELRALGSEHCKQEYGPLLPIPRPQFGVPN